MKEEDDITSATCSIEKPLTPLKLLSDGHKILEGRKAVANPNGGLHRQNFRLLSSEVGEYGALLPKE